MMKILTQKTTGLLLALTLLMTSACGYLIYPERQGKNNDRIDPAILLLDIGAFFIGVLPGVVAFAVDITTGTIFLPPGEKSVLDKHLGYFNIDSKEQLVVADSDHLDKPAIARALSEKYSMTIDANDLEFYNTNRSLTFQQNKTTMLTYNVID